LTDLAARGYPVEHALAVVSSVAAHDPQALRRLPSELDRARRAHGLSQAEAADAVTTALLQSPGAAGLDRALQNIDDPGNPHGTPPGLAKNKEHGRGQNPAAPGNHGKN